MDALFSIDNVSFSVREKQILSAISFACVPGEIVALVGNNGVGKSSLMRICAGIWNSPTGTVKVLGQDVHAMVASQRAALITWCPGHLAGVSGISVLQFLSMAQESFRFSKGRLSPSRGEWEACRKALELFDAEHLAHRSTDCLSSGEWQRVQLARAWVNSGRVLLLDEPSTALDLRHVELLISRIRVFASQNRAAVIFSSHDFSFVSALAHRVLVMHNGGIAFSGAPKDLLQENLAQVFGVRFQKGLSPQLGESGESGESGV